VLIDLPDHDSTAAEHRAEVDRLVEVVDAFVWVVDPQKYADAALHEGYLRRFAGHAAVTLVVLNQIDLLAETDRAATQEHLGRMLAEDGLVGVRVLPTSTTTGAGVDALRRELAARVAERRALLARLDADLDWVRRPGRWPTALPWQPKWRSSPTPWPRPTGGDRPMWRDGHQHAGSDDCDPIRYAGWGWTRNG